MAISLCGTAGYKNVGAIDCDIQRGTPQMILPGGAIFTPSNFADAETMDAAILTKLKLQQGSAQKLYPFPVIQGVADRTEAAKFGSLGFGLSFKLVRSKPGYEFDVLAGSELEKRLMSFDGKVVPLFILDDQSGFWGKKNGAGNFIGPNWLVSVEPRPFGDAQNAKATKVTISIVDAADFTENAYVHVTSLTTSSLTGLKDVVMRVLSVSSNVYKVKLEIPTAKLGTTLDIWAEYGALIAAMTFTAKSGTGYGTDLDITSVAADEDLDALTVTVDSTAHTALASGAKFKLIPPTAAVLDAGDVTGIEIEDLIITKA